MRRLANLLFLSALGIALSACSSVGSGRGAAGPTSSSSHHCGRTLRKAVLRVAREMAGIEWAGSARCAVVVRKVFKMAGLELPAGGNDEGSRPFDWPLTKNLPQGPEYANSLDQDNLGPRLPPDQIQSGDLLFITDTIPGYEHGVVTHVAIAISQDEMVDWSSSQQRVVRRAIATFPGITGVRRPKWFQFPRVSCCCPAS